MAAAAEVFVHYMRVAFGAPAPKPRQPSSGEGRYRRSTYITLLQGWGFDASSAQGAVLKGWVESRFGIAPTFHKAPLLEFPSHAWMQYLEEKLNSRFHNNCIQLQLDLLFEHAQCCLERFTPLGPRAHVQLYRGTQRSELQLLAGSIRERRGVLRLNNLVSFTLTRACAEESGDLILTAQVPLAKLLFFPGLVQDRVLDGEGEVLVIGGDFDVAISYACAGPSKAHADRGVSYQDRVHFAGAPRRAIVYAAQRLLPHRQTSRSVSVAQAVNRYKADLREIQFVLFEQLKLQELLGKAPFENWGLEDVQLVLPEVYRFVCEVTGPLNPVGDQEGCKLVDGQVKAPSGFREAWKRLYEAGWATLSAEPEFGGQGAPRTLGAVVTELISGSNTSFQMYGGLTLGASELIASFGTEQQKHLFCEKMGNGEFAGTMCLTEPQAGSDVGDCSTSAVKNADGTYSIKGTKIFISGGDHDLAPNIVHMVLARIEGAPKGTKGLSLFIVPKIWVESDGTLGKPNDVITASIEHKMGIAGSSTCVLNFGENDACRGYLCGTVEHQGIAQMFQMMNGARILVGFQGVAAASSAYLNALEYAKERKQGSSIKALKDPNAPRVPIISHPDVRRMLLDMKARVEGMRLLGLSLNRHLDCADVLKESDPDRAAYHRGQVDLMVPLFKAYGTDQGFQVAATAIQTYGGAGFLRDHPVEQYCRDAKIFSIYEGTNHIQALDLVGRKLRQQGGKPALDLLGDIQRFIEENASHPKLASSVAELRKAHEAAGKILGTLMTWGGAGNLELTSLSANRVLEAMAELCVGWLLLEGAVIAGVKLGETPAGKPDHAFYTGKLYAAQYFALNVLPGVAFKAELLLREDRSPLEIPEQAFASL